MQRAGRRTRPPSLPPLSAIFLAVFLSIGVYAEPSANPESRTITFPEDSPAAAAGAASSIRGGRAVFGQSPQVLTFPKDDSSSAGSVQKATLAFFGSDTQSNRGSRGLAFPKEEKSTRAPAKGLTFPKTDAYAASATSTKGARAGYGYGPASHQGGGYGGYDDDDGDDQGDYGQGGYGQGGAAYGGPQSDYEGQQSTYGQQSSYGHGGDPSASQSYNGGVGGYDGGYGGQEEAGGYYGDAGGAAGHEDYGGHEDYDHHEDTEPHHSEHYAHNHKKDGHWKKKLIWKPRWKKVWRHGQKQIWNPKWKKIWRPAWKTTWKPSFKKIWIPSWKQIWKPVLVKQYVPGDKSHGVDHAGWEYTSHGLWRKKLVWKPYWKKIWKPGSKQIWLRGKKLIWLPAWKKIWIPGWKPIKTPAWKKIWTPVWISEWVPTPHHEEVWDRSAKGAEKRSLDASPAVSTTPKQQEQSGNDASNGVWRFPQAYPQVAASVAAAKSIGTTSADAKQLKSWTW